MDYSTATQDSLPDGWPAFPGGAGYPLGPNERFQIFSSSLPRLHLAHPNLSIKVGQTGLSKAALRLGCSENQKLAIIAQLLEPAGDIAGLIMNDFV